jgi:hypothetical protein
MGVSSSPAAAAAWGVQFGATQAISTQMPTATIPFGQNASISISPAIVFGSDAIGTGFNVSFNAQIGEHGSISFGYGYTNYSQAWGTSLPSLESRLFGAVQYGNWTVGVTRFDGGGTNQFSTYYGWSDGTWSMGFDEDFPYTDKYRTGALQIGYQVNDDLKLSAGFKVFTGDPNPKGLEHERLTSEKPIYDGIAKKSHFFNADGGEYRSGVVYGGMNYKGNNYQAGWSSENVRYTIQNKLIHNQTHDPYFPYIGYRAHYYFNTGAYNPFTLY